MTTYIKGNFKKCIFKGDRGFIVGLFRVKESDNNTKIVNRTITFTGYFHELNEDDTYIFYGRLIEHDKYGKQFQVDSYERLLPEEKDTIVEFLSSNIFKGMGKKTAEKIVEHFGKDSLNVILKEPDKLLKIGMTEKQVDNLNSTLMEYESSYRTIVYLGDIGFSTRDSLLIYNKYKEKTTSILNDNIYQLFEDLMEITFKKIDTVALNSGIEKTDTRRIQATIIYIINEVCNLYGHSYLLEEEIINYIYRVLEINIDREECINAIDKLLKKKKLVKKGEKYYLKKMYDAECNIAKRCGYSMRIKDTNNKKLDKVITELEKHFNCFYNEEQREAIKLSYIKNFLIITGGPGTGKTTIIKAICELYRTIYNLSHKELVKKIALLAPTGRASKRISESTNLPASTIHRFLKWNKDTNTFAVNEHNRSDVDFVLIDEFSMVDTYLFDSLLNGLKYDTKIIIVGDYNQLPSVGPGELLKDMIESNLLNVIKLKELYRQEENSNIINLAYQINEDKLDKSIFNETEDLTFIEVADNKVNDTIIELSREHKNSQVLAPIYRSVNGIDTINRLLQQLYNPKGKNKQEIVINGVTFREKDKVIQLTNMPDDNVYNGDIGIITEIYSKSRKKEIYIDFDGNLVHYTAANFQNFKHAYAISIHKSQGSEFDSIIIPLVNSYGNMLYRKLIYTAVTRAKKKLYLVGDITALEKAISNNNDRLRRTTLKDFLIDNINNV